jgi:hypothetical protein
MNVRPSEGQFSKPIRTLCARRFHGFHENSLTNQDRSTKCFCTRANLPQYPNACARTPSAGLVIVCEMPILYGE